MENSWTLPLDWVAGKKAPATCSLAASVEAHISLLLHTRQGEWRFDPGYGLVRRDWASQAWPPTNDQKTGLKNNLLQQLQRYEPRLKNATVEGPEAGKGETPGKLSFTVSGELDSPRREPFQRRFFLKIH